MLSSGRTTRPAVAAALAALVLFAPGVTHAEEARPDERDTPPHGYVDLELGFSRPDVGEDTLYIISPRVHARLPLTDAVLIGIDWGLALDTENPQVDGNLASIMLRLERRAKLADSWLYAGGGVGLPVAQFGDSARQSVRVLSRSLALDGLRDYGLWLPEALTFFAPARWEMAVLERIRVAADAAFALHLPTDERQRTHVSLQLATSVGYRWGRSWAGLRLQLASVFLNKGDRDLTQFALGPEGRLDLGPVYVHGRLVVNIDPPHGFAFEEGGVWGLFVGFGVHL